MMLVIDAGIVFTALTGKGVTKELIFSPALTLFAPEFLFEEIEEHKSRILQASSLSQEELDMLLEIIKSRITLLPKESFENSLDHANTLISDKDDTEYLALALEKSIPIWSNDPHFKEQSNTLTKTTAELVAHLKSEGYVFESSSIK